MAPIDGKPFILYLMDYWIKQGATAFYISVGYKAQQIMSTLGQEYFGRRIEFLVENEPLGTGGAFIKLLDKIQGPFIMCNGDTFAPISHHNFDTERKLAAITLCLAIVPSPDRYTSIQIDEKTKMVLSFGHNNSLASDGPLHSYVNTGTAYVSSNFIPEKLRSVFQGNFSLEHDLLPYFLNKGVKLRGIVFKEPFIDIGTPSDYQSFKETYKDWA